MAFTNEYRDKDMNLPCPVSIAIPWDVGTALVHWSLSGPGDPVLLVRFGES